MPRLSPSASRSACPSASAQSSTVWCSSISRSPLQLSSSAKPPWRAICSSMWSKKPMPVEIATGAVRSSATLTTMSVSFVRRSIRARRVRPAQALDDRRPGRAVRAVGLAPAVPSSPRLAASCMSVSRSPMTKLCSRVRRVRGQEVGKQARARLATVAVVRGEMRTEELRFELDALRGEQRAQEVLGSVGSRPPGKRPCRGRPGCSPAPAGSLPAATRAAPG